MANEIENNNNSDDMIIAYINLIRLIYKWLAVSDTTTL